VLPTFNWPMPKSWADLPMGAYDCEVDAAGHVIFTMNIWGGTQVLGRWNGTPGDGPNYDTLAVSDAWLGMVKSRGDYTIQVPGNSLFTVGYNEPLADIHTCDYPPVQIQPLPLITGQESTALEVLDLGQFFTDLDDPFRDDLFRMADILSNSGRFYSEPGDANRHIWLCGAGQPADRGQ
jgi:hypothetical protein